MMMVTDIRAHKPRPRADEKRMLPPAAEGVESTWNSVYRDTVDAAGAMAAYVRFNMSLFSTGVLGLSFSHRIPDLDAGAKLFQKHAKTSLGGGAVFLLSATS